jgi:hypothetical protein
VVDGGGSSVREGWGVDSDLAVVPVRLEEGRSGLLSAASLPRLDRVSAHSPSGRQLMLLVVEEVVGAARWPDSEVLRRRPSDGDSGVEEWHDAGLAGATATAGSGTVARRRAPVLRQQSFGMAALRLARGTR